MKHGLASLILTFTFAHSAVADELFPIKEIEETPIELCNPGKKTELDREVLQVIRSAQQSVKCGNYEAAKEKLWYALEALDQATASELGYCYSKDSCRGAKVSAQKVSKKECKETGVGESWQQTDPTAGACVDIQP